MKEIEIMLTDSAIEPKEVKVPAHETIRLLISNFGSSEHRFAVESQQGGIEVEHLMPGQTKALEHTFTETGSFKTACHCAGGTEISGVTGSLVVIEA